MSIGISDKKQQNIKEINRIMEYYATKDLTTINIPDYRKIKEERNASKQAQFEYIGKQRFHQR